MGSRAELHGELLEFLPNVYYRPPSNLQMKYPCIVYNRTPKSKEFANNVTYLSKQGYQVTVIARDADNPIADEIEQQFQYCNLNQEYSVEGIHHSVLQLYY